MVFNQIPTLFCGTPIKYLQQIQIFVSWESDPVILILTRIHVFDRLAKGCCGSDCDPPKISGKYISRC